MRPSSGLRPRSSSPVIHPVPARPRGTVLIASSCVPEPSSCGHCHFIKDILRCVAWANGHGFLIHDIAGIGSRDHRWQRCAGSVFAIQHRPVIGTRPRLLSGNSEPCRLKAPRPRDVKDLLQIMCGNKTKKRYPASSRAAARSIPACSRNRACAPDAALARELRPPT